MRPLAAALAPTLTVVLALGLAGCTPAAPELETIAEPSPTPTSVAPEAAGDGVLRVATLLPDPADLAGTAPAQIAAVEAAVRDLNAASGVLGAPVEVLHRSAGSAEGDLLDAGFADLAARGVDVLLGPADPVLIERMLPLAAEAGIAVIVPAFDGTSATAGTEADESLAQRVRQSDPAVQSTASAPEAYDAVVLAALAAVLAEDDAGASIAFAIPSALAEGIPCASYGACLAVLETEPAILFEGRTGGLSVAEALESDGLVVGVAAS